MLVRYCSKFLLAYQFIDLEAYLCELQSVWLFSLQKVYSCRSWCWQTCTTPPSWSCTCSSSSTIGAWLRQVLSHFKDLWITDWSAGDGDRRVASNASEPFPPGWGGLQEPCKSADPSCWPSQVTLYLRLEFRQTWFLVQEERKEVDLAWRLPSLCKLYTPLFLMSYTLVDFQAALKEGR